MGGARIINFRLLVRYFGSVLRHTVLHDIPKLVYQHSYLNKIVWIKDSPFR